MVYYAETNLISIIVGVILLILSRRTSSRNQTSQMIMDRMLQLLIVLSLSDVAAYYFRGKSYAGVEISNLVYFLAMAVGAYLWFLYLMIKTGFSTDLKRTVLYTSAPIVVLCIVTLLNPVTGFFFTVDENLLYHRGSGIAVTWAVEWGYMLAALAVNIVAVVREKRSYRRSELRGYLLFSVPIAAAAACQMLFYGTTTTQVGFLVAMLMAYLNSQYYQVQRDELTGMNNKNAFLSYQDFFLSRAVEQNLTVIMVDADNFKSINDTQGHLKGDQALRQIADALKAAAGAFVQNRVMLFRYGGDEFVIMGSHMTEENIRQMQEMVRAELDSTNVRNRERGEKYLLSVSTGAATRDCRDLRDLEELVRAADDAMYQVKREKKSADRKAK